MNWHTMDEEPLMCGVILYSKKQNRIYDASYFGDGMFLIEGLGVSKNCFDRWIQREDFFKESGLHDSMESKKE